MDREALDKLDLVLNLSTLTADAVKKLCETKRSEEIKKLQDELAAKAGTVPGTSNKRKPAQLQNAQPRRDAHLHTMLRMSIPRNVATDEVPGAILVFQAHGSVLEEMGEGILAAFETESGAGLAGLPDCELRKRMEYLTGNLKAGRRPIDLAHLPRRGAGAETVYEIVRRKETGTGRQDTLMFLSIDQSSLYLKNDYDTGPAYTGALDPAIAVVVRDLYDVQHGFCIMGPKYRWSTQKICDIPKPVLEDKLYNQPLMGLATDGTKLKDVLLVGTGDSQPLAIVSGYPKPKLAGQVADLAEKVVMAGDEVVRVGMGVSFTFEKCEDRLRDVVTCCGNPNITTCHGFVTDIFDGADGCPELRICLVLHKGNFPPFLRWNRLTQDAVFQTNLEATIPACWVVSTFCIRPIPLHNLPGLVRTEEGFNIGERACPIRRHVYIAGQLDIFPGETCRATKQSPPNKLWMTRYTNEKLKSFSIFSDFCFRGGPVTDETFLERHGDWKARISVTMQSIDHFQPRAELQRLQAFPAKMALETISGCARIFGTMSPLGGYLYDLQAAVIRFAESKAKKSKTGSGSVCTMVLSMPGSVLMRLVHKYAVSTVRLREGAIEAVMENMDQAGRLLGNKTGVFNRGGSGKVQFFPPITARWVLFNPKANPDDAGWVGAEGRAELEFKRFVGFDRHGGELTGDINVTADEGANGETEGGGSGGAPAGDCHPNQMKYIACAPRTRLISLSRWPENDTGCRSSSTFGRCSSSTRRRRRRRRRRTAQDTA